METLGNIHEGALISMEQLARYKENEQALLNIASNPEKFNIITRYEYVKGQSHIIQVSIAHDHDVSRELDKYRNSKEPEIKSLNDRVERAETNERNERKLRISIDKKYQSGLNWLPFWRAMALTLMIGSFVIGTIKLLS